MDDAIPSDPVDWARVAELRREFGDEAFRDIVLLFLEEVDAVLRRLTETPDPASLREDMHFLRGSALNVGFAAFAGLCSEAERLAAGGASEQVDLGALAAAYARARQRLLDGIVPRSAA